MAGERQRIEERIRDHFNNRVIVEKRSRCDYHVQPADFLALTQRLSAAVECDDAGSHFVTLYLNAGKTRVYPDPEIERNWFSVWEPSERAADAVDDRSAPPACLENPIGITPAQPVTSRHQLWAQMRGRLLQRAVDAIAFNGSTSDSEAIALVDAYVELTKAGP